MKFRPAHFLLLILVVLIASPATTAVAQTAEELFQEALLKERTSGDLEGAIASYEAIIEKHADDREIAAKALVQLGASYEKLGSLRAGSAYEQVIRDYPEQGSMVDIARERLTRLQIPDGDPDTELVIRKVVENDGMGRVSPNGRYLSYVNWTEGNVAIYDIQTRERRDVSKDGTWDGEYAFGDVSIWSPDSRTLAYYWIYGNRADLRLVDADGTNERTLVASSEDGTPWPVDWSRDGKYILAINEFMGQGSHHTDRIVLVDTKTGEKSTLRTLPDGYHTSAMSLSPDGRFVAYELDVDGKSDIHMLAVDGSLDKTLIAHPATDSNPIWAPSGDRLFFASDRSGSLSLWSVGVSSGEITGQPVHEITSLSQGFQPKGFSTDGDFYFGAERPMLDVFVAELNLEKGSFTRQPSIVKTKHDGTNSRPFWSPDGSRFGFLSIRDVSGERQSVLIVHELATGTERELPIGFGHVETPLGRSSPRWSPDGESVVFKDAIETPEEVDRKGTYRIDVNTGEIERIFGYSEWRDFTPDGSSIVFVRGDSIMEYRLSSGTERLLYHSGRHTYRTVVSPSGSRLAFFQGDSREQDADEPGWERDLVVMPMSGDKPEVVWSSEGRVHFSWDVGLNWTPDGTRLLLATYDPDTNSQQLYTINPDTREKVKIGDPLAGDDQATHLRLSPDGQTVVFSRGDWVGEIWAAENLLTR